MLGHADFRSTQIRTHVAVMQLKVTHAAKSRRVVPVATDLPATAEVLFAEREADAEF